MLLLILFLICFLDNSDFFRPSLLRVEEKMLLVPLKVLFDADRLSVKEGKYLTPCPVEWENSTVKIISVLIYQTFKKRDRFLNFGRNCDGGAAQRSMAIVANSTQSTKK